MSGFWQALTFLTALPAPRGKGNPVPFFPWVGLMLGLILAGLDWVLGRAFPSLVASAGDIIALVLLTGGLHLDGFLDTCDGLAGRTPEERLRIMADERIGGFGVMGGASLLLLQLAALSSLEGQPRRLALVLFPILSRWGMALAIAAFPAAKAGGLGRAFKGFATGPAITLATLSAALIAGLTLGGVGWGLMAILALLSLAVGWWLRRRLGGLTGDSYGAVNEVGATATLLLVLLGVKLFPPPGGLWGWSFFW